MQASGPEPFPPPPGVIGSIKQGFDAVSMHLTAILLPLALDLLLWFGPRLSVKEYYQAILPQLEHEWKALGFSAAQVQAAVEGYRTQVGYLDGLNLMSLLRTFPIGIASLLSGTAPQATPLGQPQVVQVGSLGHIFLLMVMLTLLGWLGGALYFRWVASLVAPEGAVLNARSVVSSLALSGLAFLAMVVVGVPLFVVIYLLSALSPAIGQVALLFLGFIGLWLIVPFFFAAHGIFMRSQGALASVLSGLRMARFSLPTSGLFVLSVLFISLGLNYLWAIPRANSWMLLVGILGHAFITTALLAASFIFYRDTNAWLLKVFERLRGPEPVKPGS